MKAFAATFLLLFTPVYWVAAQDTRYLAVKNDNTKYPLKWFYVSRVVDSLGTSDIIGKITRNGAVQSKLSLRGGLAFTMQTYFDNNTSHEAGASPLTLVFNNLDISSKATARGYTTTVKIRSTIYLGDIAIQSFKNEGRMTAPAFPEDEIQAFIKSALKEQLQRFDGVWKQHKDEIPADTLAEVHVEVASTTDLPECIAYKLERKLAFDDFKSKDFNEESFAAGTSSGLRMEYSSDVEHSKMVVNVRLIPVFYKNKSWFKLDAKVAVLLAHEQTHFDITAITICEMAARIKTITFTNNQFDKQLLQLLDEYTKLKDAQGVKYDEETDHGRNATRQLEWQEKVNARIKEVGCF